MRGLDNQCLSGDRGEGCRAQHLALGSGRPARALCQDLLDGAAEISQHQRLHKKGIDALCLSYHCINSMTKASAQNNGNIGTDIPELIGQCCPRHVWHGLVGDHEVKAVWINPKDAKCLKTTRFYHDIIAKLL